MDGYILIDRNTGVAINVLYSTVGAARTARTNLAGWHKDDYKSDPKERLAARRARGIRAYRLVAVTEITVIE